MRRLGVRNLASALDCGSLLRLILLLRLCRTPAAPTPAAPPPAPSALSFRPLLLILFLLLWLLLLLRTLFLLLATAL